MINEFTKEQTSKFISKILTDKAQVHDAKFIVQTYLQDKSFPTSPMLLQFLCILVSGDQVDPTSKHMSTGEIYWRLVRYLYSNYRSRNGLQFSKSDFLGLLKTVDTLAYSGLQSNQFCYKRSQVFSEIGEEAFEYGFLISHENFRIFSNTIANVTFPHIGFQNFFTAFFITSSFCNEERLSDDMMSFLLNNCSVLNFFLWIITNANTQRYLQISDTAYHDCNSRKK